MFLSSLVFNKTIIPLTLVGYELMIADLLLRTSSAKSSYQARVRGIIVKFVKKVCYINVVSQPDWHLEFLRGNRLLRQKAFLLL